MWNWRVKTWPGELSAWLGSYALLRGPSRASKTVNLESLATELSVNARLAKDLHNFVGICHYYAADFRSLNTIAPEMIADKSVLNRSIESLEEVVGASLIQRTKGKGLTQITPSGEAVLDWWSQFYMRWTPIRFKLAGPK